MTSDASNDNSDEYRDDDPAQDGEIVARVFTRFDAGESCTLVAAAEKLGTAIVGRLHDEWLRLRERDLTPPAVPARLAALEELVLRIGEVVGEHTVKFAATPTADLRRAFTCEGCGEKGFASVQIRCTCCGRHQAVGWKKTG